MLLYNVYELSQGGNTALGGMVSFSDNKMNMEQFSFYGVSLLSGNIRHTLCEHVR